MAEKGRRTLVVTKNDGSQLRIQCQPEVLNMLLSKATDPSVKSLVMQSLLNQETSCSPSIPKGSGDQRSRSNSSETSPSSLTSPPLSLTSPPVSSTSAPSSSTSVLSSSTSAPSSSTSVLSSSTSAPLSSTSAPYKSSATSESPITSSESSSSTHTWKAEEEDLLVNLRHDKNDKFLQSKNHTALWKDISAQLNETLKCNVSPNQAMNKYYSMKKWWKEIIDAPTGTERKYFRQKDQFDEMYGTKESTKPTVMVDTLEKKSETQEPKQIKSTEQPRRKKNTVKRRSDVMEVLERHNKEFNEKMEQMHTDKMARLDRLLNLYEREIETKQSCSK